MNFKTTNKFILRSSNLDEFCDKPVRKLETEMRKFQEKFAD